MARWGRERVADAAAIDQARAAPRTDWPHFLVLELTQELCERAAAHAEVFALRAYDGVQLASAILHRGREGGSGEASFAGPDGSFPATLPSGLKAALALTRAVVATINFFQMPLFGVMDAC